MTKNKLKKVSVKPTLDYRMYGFVPYNISDIQKGIQFGHGVVEYHIEHGHTKAYKEFSKFHKTFIILNGGTTNSNHQSGMSNIIDELNGLPQSFNFATFSEPDLNDAITAITFLVDSRVYDRAEYPCPFEVIPGFSKCVLANRTEFLDAVPGYPHLTSKEYVKWVKSIGGPTNEFLRYYLSQFKLA